MPNELAPEMHAALKNFIVKEVFDDPKMFSLLTSEEFIHTMGIYYSKSFEAGAGAKHGFWANNLCPALDADGKRLTDEKGREKWEHHGLNNLDKGEGSIMRMSDYEGNSAHVHEAGKNHPLSLNQIEGREDISQELKEVICATASLVYAMGSQEMVVTSVQGANPHSFFRTTEIFAIMNNPQVKEIEILTEDMNNVGKDGRGPVKSSGSMDKKEAYQKLRDGWLESSITKYEDTCKAYEKYKSFSKTPTYEKEQAHKQAIISARNNLATEYVIARKMSQETHPFTKSGLYKENNDIKYGKMEQGKELERMKKIEEVKDIGKEFGKSEEVNKILDKQASEIMPPVDKIIYTAMELGNTLKGDKKRDFTRLAMDFITKVKQEKEIQKVGKVLKEFGGTMGGQANGVQNSVSLEKDNQLG